MMKPSMPSFSDSIFLFVLALLLFGPKRLPVLARELGKWIGEFRRASNEFKMQMEDELRQSEQAERQKQIAAMEAAAPVPPPVETEPEHPHLRSSTFPEDAAGPGAESGSDAQETSEAPPDPSIGFAVEARPEPLPIATSGSLNLMPPSSGLPAARRRDAHPEDANEALNGLLSSIPTASETAALGTETQETAAHGH